MLVNVMPAYLHKIIYKSKSCGHRWAILVNELLKKVLGFFLDLPIPGAWIKMKQGLSEKNKSHYFAENSTLTHRERPALAMGSSGRLVKITPDLHPCCLGFCRAGLNPAPTVELQTAPEGWAVRAHEPQFVGVAWDWGGGIVDCGKQRGRRVNEHVRKERGEGGHKGSPGHSQSALCKQASSWSGQVAGGSPPRATATVGRADNWWQECGICSQKEGEQERGREEEEEFN